MRRTKIICTLGPASSKEIVIEKMLRAGMNVARLNFSHGTHEDHAKTIETFRRVRDKLGLPAAIMLDTKGPEIRIKTVKDGCITVKEGDRFVLTSREIEDGENEATITYGPLVDIITPGTRILIDDGKIHLMVEETTETDIICKVTDGGEIRNRKSINIPNFCVDMPYLSEADKADVLFGIQHDVDFVAASFVRSKKDVIDLRKFIDYNGGHSIKIIAKIENMQGVENFNEILANADGIMVARGDMGVEVDFEKLPGIQKSFIRRCYQAGKIVITATQMLESMVTNLMPTRAEISDVANAVFDGTSAVMLSGETAMGVNPPHVVEVMAKIAKQAESDAIRMGAYKGIIEFDDDEDTTNAICDAACTTAQDLKARAIIAVTKSGYTARRVSKFRPRQAIVASTPVRKTYHQLAMSWGVLPVLSLNQTDTDSLFQHAIDCAKQVDVVRVGDRVVITPGVPLGRSGTTNILKVETVEGTR